MQTTKPHLIVTHFRQALAILAGLFILAGCNSEEKPPENKDDDKKPAYERVLILKERFDQLEASLDEMERDLLIQKQRIEKTRETAKAVKRSLLKGNLKGYSVDTITTDPMVIAALEKRKDKDKEEKKDEVEEEEAGNRALDTLMIIGFVIFLIAIFAVALRDRKQESAYEVPPANPSPNDLNDTGVHMTLADEITPNVDTSEGSYGEIGPRENRHDDTPPRTDEPGTEEPRQ